MPLYIKYCLLDLFPDDGTLHTSNPYLPTVTAFLNADLDFSDWCDDNDIKKNTSNPNIWIRKTLRCSYKQFTDLEIPYRSNLKKCDSLLFLLNRIKQYLNVPTRKLFYNAYILPHLDYRCSMWGNATSDLTNSVVKFLKRAARSILDKPLKAPSTELITELKWIFPERAVYQKAILMYKVMQTSTLRYLTQGFSYLFEPGAGGPWFGEIQRINLPNWENWIRRNANMVFMF